MAFTLIRLNHAHPDPSDGAEMSDRYRAALDMIEYLDERGINAVQLDEHHVTSTGWSPTPMMTAGMILARTKHVVCMIGALLLPLHDPLRVAEDLAVLDLVGRGRIVATLGIGYRPKEYAAVGKEWDERGRILDDSIDVMMKAWTGEPFELNDETIQVLPKPFSHPHPQIMVGQGVGPPGGAAGAAVCDGRQQAGSEVLLRRALCRSRPHSDGDLSGGSAPDRRGGRP